LTFSQLGTSWRMAADWKVIKEKLMCEWSFYSISCLLVCNLRFFFVLRGRVINHIFTYLEKFIELLVEWDIKDFHFSFWAEEIFRNTILADFIKGTMATNELLAPWNYCLIASPEIGTNLFSRRPMDKVWSFRSLKLRRFVNSLLLFIETFGSLIEKLIVNFRLIVSQLLKKKKSIWNVVKLETMLLRVRIWVKYIQSLFVESKNDTIYWFFLVICSNWIRQNLIYGLFLSNLWERSHSIREESISNSILVMFIFVWNTVIIWNITFIFGSKNDFMN
jgi:hypothetical protein